MWSDDETEEMSTQSRGLRDLQELLNELDSQAGERPEFLVAEAREKVADEGERLILRRRRRASWLLSNSGGVDDPYGNP